MRIFIIQDHINLKISHSLTYNKKMNLLSHTIHIIIFISTFLIPLNNAQGNSNYGYDFETDFYIITIIPIIGATLSFLGTLYIFFRK
jgi:hypothetical protein